MTLYFGSASRYFWANCFYSSGKSLHPEQKNSSENIYRLCDISSEDSSETYENAILYATGIVVLIAGNAILMNTFLVKALHNALKVRVAMCSIVYRKVRGHFAVDWYFFFSRATNI